MPEPVKPRPGHGEACLCGDDVAELTGRAQPQTDEAWPQTCLRDTLDDYIAWT